MKMNTLRKADIGMGETMFIEQDNVIGKEEFTYGDCSETGR